MQVIKRLDPREARQRAWGELERNLSLDEARNAIDHLDTQLGRFEGARTRLTLEEARELVAKTPDSIAGRAFAQSLRELIGRTEVVGAKLSDEARLTPVELGAAEQLAGIGFRLAERSILFAPLADALVVHETLPVSNPHFLDLGCYTERRQVLQGDSLRVIVPAGTARRMRRDIPIVTGDRPRNPNEEYAWLTAHQVDDLAPGLWPVISDLLHVIYADEPVVDVRRR